MSVAIPPPHPLYRYILAILTRVHAFSILAPKESVVRIPRTNVRFRSSPQQDIRCLNTLKACLYTAYEYIIGLFVSLTVDVILFLSDVIDTENQRRRFGGAINVTVL